jgi:hypothetical protein
MDLLLSFTISTIFPHCLKNKRPFGKEKQKEAFHAQLEEKTLCMFNSLTWSKLDFEKRTYPCSVCLLACTERNPDLPNS